MTHLPRLIIALLILLLAATLASGQTTQPIFGCWEQPPANFPTWKARGGTVKQAVLDMQKKT